MGLCPCWGWTQQHSQVSDCSVRFLTARCQILAVWDTFSVTTSTVALLGAKLLFRSELPPDNSWKQWERARVGSDLRRTEPSNGRQRVLLMTCQSDFWGDFSAVSCVVTPSSNPGVQFWLVGRWNTGIDVVSLLLLVFHLGWCWSWVVHHKA